jgi:hypothetical protein
VYVNVLASDAKGLLASSSVSRSVNAA